MENIKCSNIFVIPVENEDLSRSAINAYVYLYCVEKGLRAPSHTECILLHLKKDFPSLFICCPVQLFGEETVSSTCYTELATVKVRGYIKS